MKRSWRLLGLVLVAVVCLAAVVLLRPTVGHEAEMAGSIDDTQATSTAITRSRPTSSTTRSRARASCPTIPS